MLIFDRMIYFLSAQPLTGIDITILPSVGPLTFGMAVQVLPMVDAATSQVLVAPPLF